MGSAAEKLGRLRKEEIARQEIYRTALHNLRQLSDVFVKRKSESPFFEESLVSFDGLETIVWHAISEYDGTIGYEMSLDPGMSGLVTGVSGNITEIEFHMPPSGYKDAIISIISWPEESIDLNDAGSQETILTYENDPLEFMNQIKGLNSDNGVKRLIESVKEEIETI